MKRKHSKSEIWRDNTSQFVRFMFGMVVLTRYIGLIAIFFRIIVSISHLSSVLEKNFLHGVKVIEEQCGVSLPFENGSIYFSCSNSIVLLTCFLCAVLSILTTLWYHLGKSRVLAIMHFILDCMLLATAVGVMCGTLTEGPYVILAFVFLLFLTLADYLIMRSTYRYHKELAHSELYQKEPLWSTDKKQYTPEYLVTKPKLNLTYQPVGESAKNIDNRIRIDKYVENQDKQQSKSVYQKEKEITASKNTRDGQEEGDGIRVDTSLGYRRMTFDKL